MNRAGIFCCLAVLLGLPISARGGVVTWEFGGVITSVHDPDGVVTGIVDIGTPFSGSFTFDSNTPDILPDSPRSGRYDGAVVDLHGTVGGLSYSGAGAINSVGISDGIPGVANDLYGLNITDLSTPLLGETSDLSLSFADSAGQAFDNDSLFTDPPNLAEFDFTSFSIQTASENVTIRGGLTFVVPEPSTVVLLVFGLVPMFGRRHRRRARGTLIIVVGALALAFPSSETFAQWTGGPVLIGGDDTDDHFGDAGDSCSRLELGGAL